MTDEYLLTLQDYQTFLLTCRLSHRATRYVVSLFTLIVAANILTIIQNASTPPSEPAKNQEQEKYDQEDELKDDGKPPRKKATRGVAQKVRKSTRKATAAKAKPAKKTGPSTSLAALHSGTYRRSARQEAKLGTNR